MSWKGPRNAGPGLMVAGLAAAALVAAGCGGGGSGSDSATGSSGGSKADPGVDTSSKTITVGGWQIASGPNAGFVATTNAVKALFSQENAKGGVNGWKIKYMAPDDGGDPARALQEVKNQITGNQVFALVWGPGSPENQQVVPYVAQTDVPYVPPGESGDPYVGKSYKNIFPSIPPYSSQAVFLAQYAIKSLHAKNIALAYEDDAVGQPVQKRFKAAVEAMGGKVVAEVPFAASDTDLTAAGQKVASSKPDVVVSWGTGQPTIKAKQAAMNAGLNVPWMTSYFNADPGVVGLDKKVAEGLYFNYYLQPFFSDAPSVKEFQAAMAKYQSKTTAGGLALNGWAGAQIFVEALREITAGGKTPTRAALIDALNNFGEKEIGVLPGVNYTQNSHRGGSQSYVLQWKNGAFKVVTGPSPLPELQ
jgi:ABC-type branched-subunit amino acid transport system substrate-binding protein